jgi:ornithine carbamoyltransferase
MIESPTPAAAPATPGLRGRHLLGIEELSPEEIVLILDTAEAMKEVGSRTVKKVPALRGRTVVSTCSSSRARAPARRSRSPRSGSAPTP